VQAVRTLGAWAFVGVIGVWALTAALVMIDLVARLLHFAYWTDGSYHSPTRTTGIAVAFGGGALLTALFAAALISKPEVANRTLVTLLVVFATITVLSPVSHFIHVAEAQLTERGFAQARYRTSADFGLLLVNRTAAPVRVCLGTHGDCEPAGPDRVLPAGGVVVRPGGTYIVDLVEGRYRLTIVDPAPGMSGRDTSVSVDPGIQT
jgi:hypothetical protein